MAFGRDAVQTQLDTLATNQSVGVAALPADLIKMQRNDSPALDLTQVLYALHQIGDDPWPEAMETGPVITTKTRWEVVLTRFMAEGDVEGSEGYEESSRAIRTVAEQLRHRYMQALNWAPGTTGIVMVRDFRMTSRGVKREPWRLEYRYQFEVVIDEEPDLS